MLDFERVVVCIEVNEYTNIRVNQTRREVATTQNEYMSDRVSHLIPD